MVNLKGAKEIGESTKSVYIEWLAASGLSGEDFIRMADREKLEVRKTVIDGCNSIEVGYYDSQNRFKRIGLHFILESEEHKVNLSLLLLFMAARLDEAYSEKYGKDYFFNIFREACVNII